MHSLKNNPQNNYQDKRAQTADSNYEENPIDGTRIATQVSPDVAMKAVELFVDLQSEEDNSHTRQLLDTWRAQHPDHEKAWQHIENVNGQFQTLKSSAGSAAAHASVKQLGHSSRREMMKALSVLLFAGGTGWAIKEHAPWQPLVADQRTGVGELKTLTLAQGTQITLNTSSAINKSVNGAGVNLVQGEVFIDHQTHSHKSTPRELTVNSKHGQIAFHKGKLCLREFSGYCQVTVLQGPVTVSLGNTQDTSTVLNSGEQIQFSGQGFLSPAIKAQPQSSAWTQGMIVASGMALEDFLKELSRYRHGRLRCEESIAQLRVSGTYPLANTDQILVALETSLNVKVHYLTRYFVTIKSAQV